MGLNDWLKGVKVEMTQRGGEGLWDKEDPELQPRGQEKSYCPTKIKNQVEALVVEGMCEIFWTALFDQNMWSHINLKYASTHI